MFYQTHFLALWRKPKCHGCTLHEYQNDEKGDILIQYYFNL